jgi:hypothetical protein
MEEVTNKVETDKNIPSHLVFNDAKMYPPGGYKKTIIYPPTNNGPFNQTNNTISFQIGGKGFLDPYSLYIKVKVVNLNSKVPLQLDNSAHSLFSKISFRGNGTDFETIDDYDIMMSNISDCSRSNDERKACENEGYGHSYDKSALYKTENPLCVGNCEPVIQPRGLSTKDLYTMSGDRFARNISTLNKPHVAFYEVRNGVPSCETIESDTRTFIIPIWSFLFGWGLSAANYKYIPLQVFTPLEIHFKLNENAFFVPLPASAMYNDNNNIQVSGDNLRKATIDTGEISEFTVEEALVSETTTIKDKKFIFRFNNMEGEDIGIYDANAVLNVGKINAPVRKGWQIVQAQIMTEQMFFENVIHESVLTQPSFRIVTHQYKKIRETSFNKNNIPANIQLTELKGSVKYMHFIFLNNSYQRNCFQRKLFKYSLNLKRYWLRVGSDEFPNTQIDGNAGTTNGDENNSLFYLALKRCSYKTNTEKNMAINPYNFALNYSPLDLVVSDVYCSAKFSGYNEYVGRCIYAIDFERFPQTENYWSGISMRNAMPCDLYLKTQLNENIALKHSEGNNTSFNIYIFVWMDYVLEYNRNIGKWEFKD